MRCYDAGVLQAYLDGELAPHRMNEVSKHLDTCKACQKQFDELIEMNDWNAIKSEQRVSLSTEEAWERFHNQLEKENGKVLETRKEKKGVLSEMNKMKKWMAAAAAAVLIVTGVPVVATGVYNMFSDHVLNDDVVNKSNLKDTTKNGTFSPLDIKLTDQDITVHLTELYVADTRVSVHYRVEDKDGNLLPVTYDTEGRDIKEEATETEGPLVYEEREKGTFSIIPFLDCEDNLPFELMKDDVLMNTGIRELGNKNEGTITFVNQKAIAYPVVLDININKIGTVAGSWKGQVEIKHAK